MPEKEAPKKEGAKKKSKIASIVIDVVMGALLAFIAYCEIAMLLSSRENKAKVRYLFNHAGMVVLTDSMSGALEVGDGIVIEKVSHYSLRGMEYVEEEGVEIPGVEYTVQDGKRICPLGTKADDLSRSEAYRHFDDDGNPVISGEQVYRQGDIISFYGMLGYIGGKPYYSTITHRLIETEIQENDLRIYYCYGDNVHAQTCPVKDEGDPDDPGDDVRSCTYLLNRNRVTPSDILGKVTYHNKGLGSFFKLTMQPWFVPSLAVIPLLMMGLFAIINYVIEDNRLSKIEDAELAKAIEESGIDPNDKAALTVFEEKWRYTREYKAELEQIREEEYEAMKKFMKEERAKIQREMEEAAKAKAQGRAAKSDSEYAKILEEERKKILEEMAAEQQKKE